MARESELDTQTPALPRATVLGPPRRSQAMAPSGAPSTGRMIADAYHAVASQLGQVRVQAQAGRVFSDKEAQTLKTLVQTLTSLVNLERARDTGDALARLPDSELAELARKAIASPDSGR